MSIESLKLSARRHEQKEEWGQALEQYNRALTELARDETVDIGLYNRVGDLYVRVGDLDAAVEHYDKAVDLYREAYLPNNAIAVCKKIIRNVPDRHQAFLRIGQIRAEQGFLTDARTNFLTYAERMQQAGDLDESFRALIEFCDHAPDDVGVRVTVADQMAAHGRTDDAITQLRIARQHFAQNGDQGQVSEVEDKILSLDPEADLGDATVMVDSFGGSSVDEDGEIVAEFGEISLGDETDESGGLEDAAPAAVGEGTGGDAGGFESSFSTEGGGEEEGAAELPTMDFSDDTEEEAAVELPTMDFGDDAKEEAAVELPTMDFGDDAKEEAVVELPTMDFGDEAEEEEAAVELPTVDVGDDAAEEPEPVGVADVAAEGAEAVEEAIEEAAADAVAEEEVGADQAEAAEAAPAKEEYIDLGAMVLGGEEEKSTRFTVAYQEPTGDEDADFAKMLSQFKEKVSENLDSSDVRAHYDLGTAYKEMGLLDEAISSFQSVLRAEADHLPTYEVMGQTFIEMGEHRAAVTTLNRALEAKTSIDDELIGIYYYLARAYEALEEKGPAVEYYDKVFSLDINFADVTERLRELR